MLSRKTGLEKPAVNYFQSKSLLGKFESISRYMCLILWRFSITGSALFKRGMDITLSLLFLLLLMPLFLIVAIMIRLESPGPVLFNQVRVGMAGRPFKFWKFRSMRVDAEDKKNQLADGAMSDGVRFKLKNDPRITKTGSFIRKYSIDELPQLWNVLIGDMSLVGPRPALPVEVAAYSLADRQRLTVKPGITCIWQVSGRSDIPFKQQVKLDVQYKLSQSILGDIRLMFLTIPAVVLGKGAY